MIRTACLTGVVVVSLAVLRPASAVDYRVDTIAEPLDHPWSLAFLPDGDMLVTEREGRLRVIHADGLDPTPIGGVPAVYAAGQGGLFDIVADPAFARNRGVYLSYAQGSRKSNAVRVARATLIDGRLTGLKVIFTGPEKDTPHHFGGRMVFHPDGTLLITTGDGFDYRERAQLLDNLFGKVVRINPDGSIPRDNPFTETPGARPEIWTYGHRNPQAIIIDPYTAAVYLHEHGPRGGDELNLIEPGLNYGWPAVTYGVDYSGAYISPYTQLPGIEQPLTYWVPSIAPAGMTYYDGDRFTAWRGNFFVAALAERSVRRLVLIDGQVTDQEILFTEFNERMRDVRTGPNGCLYLLTDSDDGRVLRVCPAVH